MNNLGSVYFRMDRLESADEMLSRALEVRMARARDKPENLLDLGTSLMNLGKLRAKMNDRKAARCLYDKALEIWRWRATLNERGIIELAQYQIFVSAFLAEDDADKAEGLALAKEAETNLESMRQLDPDAARVAQTFLANALELCAEVGHGVKG